VDPENYEEALEASTNRPFDLTGRSMKGLTTEQDLSSWVGKDLDFRQSLPPKLKIRDILEETVKGQQGLQSQLETVRGSSRMVNSFICMWRFLILR
jgi:hypothetical protein